MADTETPVDDSPSWDDPADDYVYVPEERGIRRKVGVVIACMVLIVGAVVGYAVFWFQGQINPEPNTAAEVTLVVPEEAGLNAVARLLEEKGVVTNATVFRYYARWKSLDTIRAGEYDGLYAPDSMDHVIERLNQGPLPPKFSEITFREGLWLPETLAQFSATYPEMSQQAVLQAYDTAPRSRYQPDGVSHEGFLFPATYRVEDPDKTNPGALLTQMVQKFDQVADGAGLADAPTRLADAAARPVSPYEALIVASMVEAEAKTDADRPRVARVIYNRMREGMRLDIDATVLYALGERKTELTKSDLEVDSPYNTRKYPGLPPGPIDSPGEASLLAALNPSTEAGAEDWLYYVLIDAEGNHFFTADYNEFLRAQSQAQEQGLL